ALLVIGVLGPHDRAIRERDVLSTRWWWREVCCLVRWIVAHRAVAWRRRVLSRRRAAVRQLRQVRVIGIGRRLGFVVASRARAGRVGVAWWGRCTATGIAAGAI